MITTKDKKILFIIINKGNTKISLDNMINVILGLNQEISHIKLGANIEAIINLIIIEDKIRLYTFFFPLFYIDSW